MLAVEARDELIFLFRPHVNGKLHTVIIDTSVLFISYLEAYLSER
jgi:hypothetical protein